MREHHSVPIADDVWPFYAEMMVERVLRAVELVKDQPSVDASFAEVRDWVTQVQMARVGAVSLLLALQPFRPFDHSLAEEILVQLRTHCENVAASVRDAEPVSNPVDLRNAAESWPILGGSPRDLLLQEAFGLETPPLDTAGEFKPSRVFQAYSYRNSELIGMVVPHLSSLGTIFSDVLAGVSAIGEIVWASDQVTAYISMDSLLNRLSTSDVETVDLVLTHLRGRDMAARQTRDDISNLMSLQKTESNEEQVARNIAEIYRKLLEGPVRQFGWAFHCLKSKKWGAPPPLSRARDAMISTGGIAEQVAQAGILVSVRNGSAHEDLHWDGFDRVYRVDDETFEIADVTGAGRIALAFARGCEAALICFRAESAVPVLELPQRSDPQRMPGWERAEAFFGTNNLVLVEARFNAATARITLDKLELGHINPCFQALMNAHRLIPKIERFEVRTLGESEPAIEVSSSDLDQTMPVWIMAINSFDRMPLATFLPANLATRSATEDPMTAARSVAWIAADDAVDALDGSADVWKESDVELLKKRLDLVELAISQTLPSIPLEARIRPNAVHTSIVELRAVLGSGPDIDWSFEVVNALQATHQLRHYWATWGPVRRLPRVREEARPENVTEQRPSRRIPPPEEFVGWVTI